jgi:hypothetical protein
MEIILYVQDMNSQVAFCRDMVGIRVTYPEGVTDFSREMWVTLGTGACTLVLHGGGKRRLGEDAPKIVFRVADIEAVRRDLVNRGVGLGEARSPARGCGCATGPTRRGTSFPSRPMRQAELRVEEPLQDH